MSSLAGARCGPVLTRLALQLSKVSGVNWTRLSRRALGPDGPYEGVPQHLHAPIAYWFQGLAGYRSRHGMREHRLRDLAMRLRLGVPRDLDAADLMHQLLSRCEQNDELYLDLIDASLDIWSDMKPHEELASLLDHGGSVWKVDASGTGLVRRVTSEMQEAFNAASQPADLTSDHLTQAWSLAFGRSANASDAWDHAIKSIETILCPLVEPQRAKPTLGTTLATLEQQKAKWMGVLPGKGLDHPVEEIIGMLRLIWPNPDRHGAGPGRIPTIQEGQAAVVLTASLIQWQRLAFIVKRR